ncbi:MAG: phosphoheptose isomerase [Omnitrophica bacterium RBG_13_46_9]|nr:MAG: phosphoheptose isomerase [Omnitrophica bacterium RBG_13_46_9]
MKNKIKKIIRENEGVNSSLLSKEVLKTIEDAARRIIRAIKNGCKVIVFGNGGSAADSQHMVAELIGRFKKERKAIPALSLTTNTSSLTALSNDYSYDIIFRRQLEALAKEGDIAIGISTSGMANNVIEALTAAKGMGLETLALTGKDGGRVDSIADLSIVVRSHNTARIQEAHILIIHILCELIEEGISR